MSGDVESACTGVSATWCPKHGDCKCEERTDGMGRTFDDAGCPLHGRASTHPEPAAWRFDVPEVPDSVTAFEDAMRNVFVRDPDCPEHWYVHPADHRWAPYRFRDLAVHCSLPLVECEDPRAAS